MALIKCIECNNQISEYAEACPHCGCPMSVIQRLYKEKREKEEELARQEAAKIRQEEIAQLRQAHELARQRAEQEAQERKLRQEREAKELAERLQWKKEEEEREERLKRYKEQGKCITWENIDEELPCEGYDKISSKYTPVRSYYMAASFNPQLRECYEDEYYIDPAIKEFAREGFKANKGEAKAPDTARLDFYRWLNKHETYKYRFSAKDIRFIAKNSTITKDKIYEDRIVAISSVGYLEFNFKKPIEITYKNAVKVKVKSERIAYQILCECALKDLSSEDLTKLFNDGIERNRPDVLIEMTDEDAISQEIRDLSDLTFLNLISWVKGTTTRHVGQTIRTYTATSQEWECDYTLKRIDYTDRNTQNEAIVYIRREGHNVDWFPISPENELIQYIKENNIHEYIESEAESGIHGFGVSMTRRIMKVHECIYCHTRIPIGIMCDKCRDLYNSQNGGRYPAYDPNARGSNGYSFYYS